MNTIRVYDSPMCCSTGVCGPEIDSNLAQFAGDLDWLKSQGVEVQRFNLAQEPERFIENHAVKAVLERSGDDELPAILVGETLVSSGRFPSRDELSAMAGLETIDAAVNAAEPLGIDQDNDKPNATYVGCCGGSNADICC